MDADFFQFRNVQSGLLASRRHPLNPTAPLLNQAEFVKNPPDHAIPQHGNALPDVLYRQAKRQEPGIFDLDPVIEQSEADGSPLLGVVGVDDRVHERLPNRDQRNRPPFLPAHALDDRLVSQMFASKSDRLLRGAGQQQVDECHCSAYYSEAGCAALLPTFPGRGDSLV